MLRDHHVLQHQEVNLPIEARMLRTWSATASAAVMVAFCLNDFSCVFVAAWHTQISKHINCSVTSMSDYRNNTYNAGFRFVLSFDTEDLLCVSLLCICYMSLPTLNLKLRLNLYWLPFVAHISYHQKPEASGLGRQLLLNALNA